MLVIQNTRDVVQILGSLSYKICSTLSPKSVIIEPSLHIFVNPPSSASALLLCYDDIKYWSISRKMVSSLSQAVKMN